LPPGGKYDRLETHKFGQWFDVPQILMSNIVELYQAIKGPCLTEIKNHRYVRIPANDNQGDVTTVTQYTSKYTSSNTAAGLKGGDQH
jgi:hypothetical protein